MAFQGFVDEFTNSPIQTAYSSYLGLELTGDVQLQWPTLDQNTPNPASQLIQVTSNTSSSNAIIMPSALQVSVQQTFIFTNSTNTAYEVKNVSGSSIVTIPGDGTAYFVALTDNSTEAGTWLPIVFGGTLTPADAATLVGPGYGLIAENSLIKANWAITSISGAPYTLDNPGGRGHLYVWQQSAGSGNFNLLPANSVSGGFVFAISNQSGVSGSGGTVSILPAGTDLINGQLSSAGGFTLFPQESLYVVSDGASAWYTIGSGQIFSGLINQTTITMSSSDVQPYIITTTQASNVVQSYVVGSPAATTYSARYPASPGFFLITNSAPAGTIPLTVGNGGSNSYTIVGGETISVFTTSTNMFPLQSTLNLNDGSALAPSLSFISDQTSGLYLNATYVPSMASHGVDVVRFNGASASQPLILANSGANPRSTYGFIGAPNWGMGYDSAQSLDFFVGSTSAALSLDANTISCLNPVLIYSGPSVSIRGFGLLSNTGIGFDSSVNAINFFSNTSTTATQIGRFLDTSGTSTTFSIQEASTPTAIGYMKISGTGAAQVLAFGTTADQIRLNAGSPNTIDLLNNTSITGTLTITGGAGSSSGATNAIFPAATTLGDMLYWNGTAWVIIPAGTGGQTLKLPASGPLIPTWTT